MDMQTLLRVRLKSVLRDGREARTRADVVDVVYDFYGERLATCSADQRIKLFRRSNEGSWDLETEWKAHEAPILRLSFAHPLHGSLLASCSHDRTVRIWEEPSASSSYTGSSPYVQATPSATVSSLANKEGRWMEKGVLSGMKGSVRDVEFGPADPGLGLRVASISTDSHLRIHLSLDPSLTDWSLAHDVYVPSLPVPGVADEGNEDGAGAGATTAELATGGWGLSWCKEKWWGSVLACFAGSAPGVRIISLDPTPTTLLHLVPPTSSFSSPLTSLSWAPSCGRSYHHLATGARDGSVRIWKVTPPDADDEASRGRAWKSEIIAEFARGARVGMIDWNATGTILTTSDDDGMVRIYKQTYAKEWKMMGKMTAEEPSDEVNGH